MKSKRTLILAAEILLLLCILVPALFMMYSRNEKTQSTSQKKEEIKIISSWGGDSGKTEVFLNLTEKYMKENPNVVIQTEHLSDEEFCVKLMTDFAIGNEADIVMAYPCENMSVLCRQGKIAPLNDIGFNVSEKEILDTVIIDGNIYGIPTEKEYGALYINRRFFDGGGIKVPENLEELKTAAKSLRKNGVTPIAFGLKDKDMLIYQVLLMANDSDNREEDTVKYLKELYDMTAFPENAEILNRSEAQKLFLEGEAAMIFESSTFAGIAENQHKFDNALISNRRVNTSSMDIVVFPSGKDKQLVLEAGEITFFASKKAMEEKNELVTKFIEFITDKTTIQSFYDSLNNTPIVEGVTQLEQKNNIIKRRDELFNEVTRTELYPQNKTEKFMWTTVTIQGVSEALTGQ